VVDAVMKENEDCGLSREDRSRIRQDIAGKYRTVAVNAAGSFAYPTGRAGLEGQRYPSEVLNALPEEVLTSFCGVGNPFSLGDIPPGAAVLDIGCGAGVDCLIAAALAGSGSTVAGIDLVPEMIARARQNARRAAAANVSFLTGSAEALPFREARFDLVISNGVFNLVPDKSRALREVLRVLKPEGRFYLADQAAVSAPCRDTGAKVAAWAG
jgi:arsenite methyltransferase